jgi:hypothetical protein
MSTRLFILIFTIAFPAFTQTNTPSPTNAVLQVPLAQPSLVEQRVRTYLQPLLHSGESKTNLIAKFGSPFSESQLASPGLTAIYFKFSDKDSAALGKGAFGFFTIMTNNQLSSWYPICQK